MLDSESSFSAHLPRQSPASGLSRDGALEWLVSLSPWPEHFGLERMRSLLAALGEPQRRFASIHVVGTNGKSSTTLLCAALLAAEGVRVGAYVSPHVRGWSERIQLGGRAADLEGALARVRPHGEGATQFEVLTAAALAEFAAAGVEVAVVEAGLGGRHDATNVLGARVVVLTNVALDHTDILGETRAEIAAEKLAVVRPGAVVVIGEPEWREAATAAAPHGSISRQDRTSRSPWRLPRRCSAGLSIRMPPTVFACRAGSSGGASDRSSCGTARTTWPGSATCSHACRLATIRSSPRSSPTRTWSRCCGR